MSKFTSIFNEVARRPAGKNGITNSAEGPACCKGQECKLRLEIERVLRGTPEPPRGQEVPRSPVE